MKRREFIRKAGSSVAGLLSVGLVLTRFLSSHASALQLRPQQHKHRSPRMEGYGTCSVAGCPCPGFVQDPGYSNMCSNCGHNYQLHN